MLDIQLYLDHVVIEGQTIERPVHVSRSEWQQFWERAARLDEEDDE